MSPKREKEQDSGFADRWSRLKQDARKPLPTLENEPAPDLPAEAGKAPETRSDDEILEALGLPDPDSLKPGDDFTAFMAKAVPARLRSRALRRLWISNPVLANLDELVDYGEDFTDAAMVVENLATGYQVGKGWAEKIFETPKPHTASDDAADEETADAELVELADAEAAAETNADPEDAPPQELADQKLAGETTAEQIGSDTRKVAEAPVAPQQFPINRRMRFRVAED